MDDIEPYSVSLELPVIEGVSILGEIGRGGGSVVYRATEEILQRTIAVKVISTTLDSASSKKFRTEARTLASLRHPNIVDVYQYGITRDGRPYLSMEFIAGQTLAERLKQGPLKIKEFKAIFSGVLSALQMAHSSNIIHRDIKPANIAICQNTTLIYAKLLDFGIAKLMDVDERTLTDQRVLLGSPLYMSPEQIAGGKIDERTDLYSLGCVMYESLVGKPPFEANNPMEVIYKHVNATRPRREILERVGVPSKIAQLVLKAISIEPSDRFSSALEIQEELNRTSPRAGADDLKAPPRQTGRFFSALFLCGILVLLIASGFHVKSSSLAVPKIPAPALRDHIRSRDRDAAIGTLKAALSLGRYQECACLAERLLKDNTLTFNYRLSIALILSQTYAALATRSTSKSEIENYSLKSRKLLDSLIHNLEDHEEYLSDGLNIFAGAFATYLNYVRRDFGIDSPKLLYEKMSTRPPYSTNPRSMRHLIRGWIGYLQSIKAYDECKPQYRKVLHYDREYYGQNGVTTLTDEIAFHNLLLITKDDSAEFKLLSNSLVSRLSNSSLDFGKSDRVGFFLTITEDLTTAGRVKEAEKLLTNHLNHSTSFDYDKAQLACIYGSLSRVYHSERRFIEERDILNMAITSTDSDYAKSNWIRQLSQVNKLIEKEQGKDQEADTH